MTTTDYGTDVHCLDTYKSGRYATGLYLVAQNAYHRLITPQGMLRGGEEEQLYGIDLPGLVGRGDDVIPSIPGRIKRQLKLDARIDDVAVTMSSSSDGPATSIVLTVQCLTGAGPFELVLAVSDVSVDLLGMDVEAD